MGASRTSWTINLHDQALMGEATDFVDEFNDWIRKRGGIDVDVSFMKLVVLGQRQGGVTITGMRAVFEEESPPLRGALFYAPPESERQNSSIGFNLDEQEPVARLVDPNKNFGDSGYLGPPYFRGHNITIDDGQSHVFSIAAITADRYYAWYIEMELVADGRTQSVRIGLTPDEEKGQEQDPFKITAQMALGDGKKGRFSAYQELYILNRDDPAGFIGVNPQSFRRVT